MRLWPRRRPMGPCQPSPTPKVIYEAAPTARTVLTIQAWVTRSHLPEEGYWMDLADYADTSANERRAIRYADEYAGRSSTAARVIRRKVEARGPKQG